MSAHTDVPITGEADKRTANDALRDLQQTLRHLVSSDGLSILASEKPTPPRDAGLHPLSVIPLAHARRKLNQALYVLTAAAHARESWDDDKAERLIRVKNDAIAKIRAVRASKASLAECRRIALTADPFASPPALALQRLRAVAEETGATTDATPEGSDVQLLVCGTKFLADFIFSDIHRTDHVALKVNFRYLTENDVEIPDQPVSQSFAKLVEQQQFPVLRTAFQRLMDLEKLSASIPGISLIESLRALEEDLLAAQALETKPGVTEDQRMSHGHGIISRTAQGLQIRFAEGHVATLGVEDANPPVAISIGRSQLVESGMTDGALPTLHFADIKTASVPACYVLRFEKPIVVCLSIAQSLERVGGTEKPVRPTVVKASGAGRELFTREKEERKPHWPSVQRLLAPDVFASSGRVVHWSLTAAEFVASAKTPDNGFVEFSHSGNDMMSGVAISRVPICDASNVKPVLAMIKQQLVFNELFQSCFAENVDTQGRIAVVRQLVEVVVYDSPSFMQLSLYDATADDIVGMAVRIAPGGEVSVTLKTSDGRPQGCSDTKASAILSKCRNLPLTIATIVKIGIGAAGKSQPEE